MRRGASFNEGDLLMDKNSIEMEERALAPEAPMLEKVKVFSQDDEGVTSLYAIGADGVIRKILTEDDILGMITEETDPLSLKLDQTEPEVITAEETPLVATDDIYFGDTSDSGKFKKAKVQKILDMVWLLPPVEEAWDVTGGLPVDPDVGDRYIADGTGEGWTDGYIYEWNGTEWVATVPEEGFMVWLLFELVFWVFFSGGWMEMGEYSWLRLDGSNANSDINIGSYDFTTSGKISGGSADIGDGTNEARFATDGELTLHGTARAWKSWDVRPNAVKLPGANPPAEATVDAFPMLRFDRSTEESVYYLWEVPNDFATGTGSVKGRFEFIVTHPPTSGGTNLPENVRMGFEYKKISDGAEFDFMAGTSGGYIDEEIAVDETAEIIHQTSEGVCDTTGWVVGDTILFRFYRDATAPEDTYDNEASAANNDVWVYDFHMNYLVDKLGTAS